MTPLDLSVAELSDRVRSGALSAEEVTRAAFERIAAERDLNAFPYIGKETALATARSIDARRSRGEPLGPLAGVPIAVKDALCTHDAPTTCASKVLVRADGGGAALSPAEGFRPPYDATAVARLRKADAVIVGKTNMDEFAMGSSNENSAFGSVKNPWDRTRMPGGSSGGSAAAVSLRASRPAALGSDTGGSIRQPAGALRRRRREAELRSRIALRARRVRVEPRSGRARSPATCGAPRACSR